MEQRLQVGNRSSVSPLSLVCATGASPHSFCPSRISVRPLSAIPHIAQTTIFGAARRRRWRRPGNSSVNFLILRRTSTSCPLHQQLQCTSRRLRVTCEVEVEMEKPEDQMLEGAIELHDAAEFSNVAHEDLISIGGFGSLLSERSARYTFPNLLNFRVAVLPGFRRVFAHVAPIFLERGIANVATKEMSSLSVEPCPGESIVLTVFDISISEVPAFIEREHEFRYLGVPVFSLQGEPLSNKAVVCARYSDKEFRQYRCPDNEEYQRRYGRFNIDKIWRDDILPCRVYLRHCVLAAKNLGQDAYDSFLDHTYLGDRITTIRQHLTNDEQIMVEEPPPLLRVRYGG